MRNDRRRSSGAWITAAAQEGSHELIELAKQQAAEIACAGHNGWGNTMLELADALDALRAEVDRWKSSYNAAIELKGRAFAESDRLAEALRRLVAELDRQNDPQWLGSPIEQEARAALHPTAAQENDHA